MSRGQASSLHVGGDRDQSVNSGKNKQLQTYDPVYAGKKIAVQGNAGRDIRHQIHLGNNLVPGILLSDKEVTKWSTGMMMVTRLSCLGSRKPGVKDTPFLGSVRGAKEAEEHLLPGGFEIGRASCRERVFRAV